MYCRKCGKTIPDNSVFCSYCGCETVLSPSSAENSPQEKSKSQFHNSLAPIVLTVILVVVAVVCVLQGFKVLTTDDTANIQSTAPTLPLETAPDVSTPTEDEKACTDSTEMNADGDLVEYPTQEIRYSNGVYDNLTKERAEELVGFTVQMPQLEGYTNLYRAYSGVFQTHYQILVKKGNVISSSENIMLRKAHRDGNRILTPGLVDYNETKMIDVDGRTAKLHFLDGVVKEADWEYGEFAYNISIVETTVDWTEDMLIDMIRQID